MRVVAFAPKWDKPPKKDATKAFQPEAKRFMEYHTGTGALPFIFDNHQSPVKMRRSILYEIALRQDLDCVAFFCHGTKRSLQPGFDLSNAKELARVIASSCVSKLIPDAPNFCSPTVVLYACDTARDIDRDKRDDLTDKIGGDGGFADSLRDALCVEGAYFCRVVAHSATGHTDRLPHVRFFEGRGSATGGIGGFYPVPFRSRLWKKWLAALKTDFRFEYPFLSVAEIIGRLESL